MSQFSCDAKGILTFYDDQNKKLFDRATPALAAAGWSTQPSIANQFALTDETTGVAKTSTEVEQQIVKTAPTVELVRAAVASPSTPSAGTAAAIVSSYFGSQGEKRLSLSQLAVKHALTVAQVQSLITAAAKVFGITNLKLSA